MDKYEISKRIEEFAPLEMAESWDTSGWVIDNQNSNDIAKVMLSLTPTEDVFQQALQEGCDMVVSHHPMFYLSLLSHFIYGFAIDILHEKGCYC